MTIVIETSVEIERSPEDVFAAIADIPGGAEWVGVIEEIRDFSGEPVGVGTTYKQVTKFLGKEFTIDSEVIVFEPGERYGERFGGVIPGEMLMTLEDVDGVTILRVYFEGEPSGFFGIASPLLKRNMQKQLTGDLDNLKRLLEG